MLVWFQNVWTSRINYSTVQNIHHHDHTGRKDGGKIIVDRVCLLGTSDEVISIHTLLSIWLLIHVGLKLTHWGRVTHIGVSKLNLPSLVQIIACHMAGAKAIIWTNAGILLIGPMGTNFSEILIEIYTFSLKKCIWKCRLVNGGHFVLASMS